MLKLKYWLFSLMLCACTCIVLAYYDYNKTNNYLSLSAKTAGEVVDVVGKGYTKKIRVRFLTRSGDVIRFTNHSWLCISHCEKGQSVLVAYIEELPQSARLISFESLWLRPLLATLIAIITMIVLLFLIIKNKSPSHT